MPRTIPTFFWEFPGHKPPPIDLETYRLRVHGAVARPAELSLADLAARLPTVERKRRFYCVNGWSLEADWRGHELAALIQLVEPDPAAPFLRAISIGGYEDTTAIKELIEGQAMLVTHMNGEPLSPKRGKPIRLMVFNLYQFKGVKALGQLELVANYRPGTWQKVGYRDAFIQPYPHLAIDKNEDLMPDADVLGQPKDNPTCAP